MADFYGRLLGWDKTFNEPNWVLMRDRGRHRLVVPPLAEALVVTEQAIAKS